MIYDENLLKFVFDVYIYDYGQDGLPGDPFIDISGDPGHFVSEFMGYHGVWYRDLNLDGDDKCISA